MLEPDDDQLPAGAPANFDPVLVTLSYTLGADGRVADCHLERRSKDDRFDAASCDLLRRHFPAARVASSGPQQVAVNWTPRAIRPERRLCNNNHGTVPVSSDRGVGTDVFAGAGVQAGSVLLDLEIGAMGHVDRCLIKAGDVSAGLQRNLCTQMVNHAIVLPATDAAGAQVPGMITLVVRFVLG